MNENDSGKKAVRRGLVALAAVLVVFGAVVVFDWPNAYLWVKALHVVAVIAWMAGLLYLPRLFVYHHQSATGSGESETFKVMERRLFRGIMNPAMMIAWLAGLYLAWEGFRFEGGWLHVKLLAVVLLTATHVYYGRALRSFADDGRPGTDRFWRIMNEVPALLMMVIVVMVVVKPF